jgi:meiotically up-regulated gene 157 (Mug157) protein
MGVEMDRSHRSQPSRRDFLKQTGIAAAGMSALGARFLEAAPALRTSQFESKRPRPEDRRFRSGAVEAKLLEVKSAIADRELAWLFENCYPNTLDTTVDFTVDSNRVPDTFVITGDIEAMWLRDSSAQVWPYLAVAREDIMLRRLLAGVINRQTRCILIDPYANAFNREPGESQWKDDLTDMKPELHERKWEVDSLCYPIRLAHRYWRTTGDTNPFGPAWQQAMQLVVQTFREQQRKRDRGPYKFQRVTGWQTDTVAGAGYGNPIRPVGLICSIFRPSDDATIFPFLVPSNLFAVTSLRQLGELYAVVAGGGAFETECLRLADEVEVAVERYAQIEHDYFGTIFPYEVDGFGNRLYMDDANIPSLLSLPYLGCCDRDDPVYENTRAFVLSDSNPYFFRGSAGEGIGSEHVGLDMIWPLSVIMRAMTSIDDAEILDCLRILRATHAGTGFMHESFHKNDPERFTRPWFAWANTLFGELIVKLHTERRHLLGELMENRSGRGSG